MTVKTYTFFPVASTPTTPPAAPHLQGFEVLDSWPEYGDRVEALIRAFGADPNPEDDFWGLTEEESFLTHPDGRLALVGLWEEGHPYAVELPGGVEAQLALYLTNSANANDGAIPTPRDAEVAGVCARPTASRHYGEWVELGYLSQPYSTTTWARGPQWEALEGVARYKCPEGPILRGWAAIEHAESHGLLLSKYADPLETDRAGVTVEEAREIAQVDPNLLWCPAP